MILVPRQLQRTGLTGDVPYYGGRFTPAQAYAASHPRTPAAPPAPVEPATPKQPAAPSPARSPLPDPRSALAHLLETGVITAAEYDDLIARVAR